VGHLVAEDLLDPGGRDECVLHHVVQQTGADGHDVQLHVRKGVCNLKRMNEIWLS
jgi:hypothetical protein